MLSELQEIVYPFITYFSAIFQFALSTDENVNSHNTT
jgi:hypothetical protein